MDLTEKVLRAFADTGRHAKESLLVEMAARIMDLEARMQPPESASILPTVSTAAKKPTTKPAKK